MKRLHTLGSLSSLLMFSLAAGSALADVSAAERATATLMVDAADKLLKSGKYAEACPKFADAERIDPEPSTLMHLAECYEKSGRTASAWMTLREAVEMAGKRGDKREAAARSKASALESKVSKLVITVAPNAPQNMEIREDDNVLGPNLIGLSIPVDAGRHTIMARAYGYKIWSTAVDVRGNGDVVRVMIPPLDREGGGAGFAMPMMAAGAAPPPMAPMGPPPLMAPMGPPPPMAPMGPPPPMAPMGPPPPMAPPPPPVAPAAMLAPPPPPPMAPASSSSIGIDSGTPAHSSSPGTTQRTLGYVVGGLGIVSLGAGTFFYLRYKSKTAEADSICTDPCIAANQAEQDQLVADLDPIVADAENSRRIAIGTLIGGGAAVTLGAVLILTAPRRKSSIALAPWTTPNIGGAILTGAW